MTGPGGCGAPTARCASSGLSSDPVAAKDRATASGIRRAAAVLAAVALALLVLSGSPATAQELTLDLGDEGSLSARSVQLLLLLTVLSVVPGLAITLTCFPFVVTVLSILRQAIGLPQAPPNMLIVSLALFLSWYVMDPVLQEAWARGIAPMNAGTLPLDAAFRETLAPFRVFMAGRVDPETLAAMQALRAPAVGSAATALPAAPADVALSVLVPSFLLSEIQRAFEIGFLIFLPFLVIDLVVAAILMSMGMMMVPPAVVALPFKLAFFVVADGWSLLATALVRGYG
jgi:flagellar biosynthesis protein FliP